MELARPGVLSRTAFGYSERSRYISENERRIEGILAREKKAAYCQRRFKREGKGVDEELRFDKDGSSVRALLAVRHR